MSYEEKRKQLVQNLIRKNVLKKLEVIRAMSVVPRELFVRKKSQHSAYIDSPLSIGCSQTISAPHMNAMMCEYLRDPEILNTVIDSDLQDLGIIIDIIVEKVVNRTGKSYDDAYDMVIGENPELFNLHDLEKCNGRRDMRIMGQCEQGLRASVALLREFAKCLK